MPDFITTGRIKSMNQQQYTPSQTKTDRIASMLGPVNTTVTTSTGKQYTLDDKQVGWIQNRYKSKMADTYGYDDADQLAKRNGQLSAAALKTYKNTNVDRQLAELGLPSEKELGKYLEDYSRWHTGGMDQVFGQMNLPKDYWTKTKGFYQTDMQKAYEDTAEDQQRKARGLMPKKWEDEYTDTEIDEQLRARGLPPISKFKTYAERWDNYQGIENFYANVARNETNLRLAGIKDDDTVYPYNGEEYKGKDLYAMAFYDELDKVNDDGSYVYGSIRPLFKNSSSKETTPTGDYLYDRGAAVLAENKNAVSADDYASYNAFSYDDYKSKYNDYYERYFANQQITGGQTVSERLAVQQREEDEEATKEYYTIGKEPEAAETFAHQYAADYPDATPEQMFLDMNQHNVPDTEAYKVYETMKKEAAGTSKWYDIVNGWTKTYGGVWSNVNNSDAPIPDVAKPLTDEQRDAQVEKDLVKAAQQYGHALVTGDNDALYYASERVKTLGFNNQEDLVESLKAGKSDQFVQAVKDAITVYESAMAAYEDTAGPGAPSEASREPINKADEALRALGFKSIHDAIRYVGGEKEAMSPAKWVAQEGEKADSYVQSKKDAYANDTDTINDTANTIQSTVARLIDKNDELGKQLDVDTLLSVIDSISDKSSTNPTAMRLALTDLGFLGDELSGWAGDITEGWSDADKRKLNYYLGGNNFTSMTAGEGGANNDWSEAGSSTYSRQLKSEDFSLYLEYALQQVNAGNMTEADAYNLLAAKGYQEEMDAYMPEEWHKAHFIENTAPGLWDQSREEDRLLWEDMTPEEQRAASENLWNDLTPEQKSAMYEKGWWKFDPSVYRTFGQALEQQFQAVLPGLGAEIISTPVKVLDAIEAGIGGRPDMWETTQNLMAFQQRMGQLGAVTDNVNGAQVAQTAADVVQEIGRMYYYGSIGGAIGGAFAGTSAGAAVMSGAASSSKVVRGASKMFMSMVKSSPFMVSAFANNYSEVKDRGASNSEATWFGLITGLSEGILEGFEFDNLWGKALGQKNFAELLTAGKHTYLERLGIIGKSWISSMAVSGLGEFTEESIGYVLETFLKMRHSDTWGKGTEWSAEDWLQQAMMGFITGALGGGIAAGSSWVADGVKLTNAMKNNPQLQAALPDVLASIGIADSVPDSTMATYREGGAAIMSKESYDGALTALKSCTDAAQNNINEYKKVVAAEDLKLENRLRELDGYAAKVQSIDTSTGKGAKELANLVSSKLGVKLDMGQPLAPQVKAAFKASVDSAVRAHDTAVSDIRASTETALQNSELELQGLQKKFQEHYVGLYLQNEGLLNSLSEDMLTNLAKAYQNGAKYEPGQATEQQAAKQSQLAEAEANETMAEAEQAAETPDDAVTKARELAYNRVYKDQEAGKAYAEGRRGAGGSNMTRVEFAENERQNFQAKTTARLRRVTLELAGLEAKDGMSAKEIFEEAKKAMTPEAAQKLDMYQKLSKALGLNMVVRDVVAGTSGYVHDGKLYVTLNGKQSMLRVASHELTHYMKDHASAQYDALRTHLVNEVGQERFDQMLAEKAQEYSLDLNDEKGRLEVDDEVCAELCEKMLENPDALERFVQSDLDAAKTLKARLGKTLVAIKSAIRSIGTSDAQTKADYIKEQETIESWYKGLSDAIDNANRAKGKTSTATETATVTETTTEAQPQAPPVETNPDLYMGDESARREQLRAELQDMAKRGTRVNGLSYQEVNDVLDRVILGDKSNYSKADYAQIRGMLSQLIPEVQAMVNGGESVDVDALNERVSAALDYMLERYSEGSEDYYGLRDLIPNKIALTEAAYNEMRSRDMTLRDASNELRKALGGKFVSFVYKKSPDYNNAMSIDELWTRITDAYGEPDGYGNIQEDALALIDYAKDRNTRTSFDDLYGSQREDVVNAQVGEFLDAVQSAVEGKSANKSEAARYTLDPVDPIEPTSDLWSKTATTDEAKEAFPDLWDVSSEESEDNNPTQRKSTESTYRKIYDILRKEGFNGKILDASSGMGYGTRLGREEYGFDVEDIEPYPGKDYNPMYKDYSTLNEKYDAIISSAVLNVLPQDQRDALVVKMGKMLNPGGKMYVTTRGTKGDVDNLAKTGKNIQLGPSEFVETVHGSYQKGFTNPELKAYLEDALGPGFTVEVSNKDNGGKFNNNTSIVVTKNGSDVLYALDDDYMPLAEKYDAGVATEAQTEELNADVAEAARDAGYDVLAYHGTSNGGFNIFDYSKMRFGLFGEGFYFTEDPDVASSYMNKGNGKTPQVYKVFLRTGNEIDMDAEGNYDQWAKAADVAGFDIAPYVNEIAAEKGSFGNLTNTDYYHALVNAMSDDGIYKYDAGDIVQGVIREMGFDGIRHIGGLRRGNGENLHTVHIVFNSEDIKSAAPVTYDNDGNIIPLSERFNQNETDIRWTVDDDLDDLVQQYGTIEQGREPRARDVQVPRQSADNMRTSKFTRSLEESSKVTNEQASEIQSEIGSEADRVKQLWSYIPKSNDETMRKAKEFIAARQPATAQREFHDMVVGGKYGTKTAAIGLQLLSDASARDDWASVKDIAYDLRVLATEAGQSAQIFNVLKDLKGVGSAWYVEKLVNNLNTMYADEIQSGQMDPITVSEAAMNQVRAAKTQVEVDAAEKAVADEIGPQLPLKLDEKLSNWRYLSMLGNPVTHIRNVTGNNLMHLMGGMKDVVASGVQRILEKTGVTDESDRAHARLTSADKSYWDDFAQKSYDEQKRNLQGGGKLGFQSLVQQSKRSFDNKVLDAIARGKDPGTMSERKGLVGLLQNIRNNGAMGMLEVEDAWGLEKNYKRSLMEYMKAQEYSLNDEGKVGKVGKDGSFTEITNEQMNKAIEWATNQAWTNTFRGPSQLATELNKISKMNTASKLIVEGVMPFKKTPINIAKQGAMYSPAGIVVGTTELLTKVKQGKMSAATAIDHLSSGLTGTALMALGVVLAKAGILRGGGEDKKKLETYLEDTGDQTYAFKFGNVSINMSAIAPATIPLFMGVALQEMLSRNGDDEGVDLSTITDVLAGTLNPFMEMSFMSSLNSALKNYNNEGIGGALGSTIMTAAQNYGSQYLPTLGGKVAQFIDPTQRTTKSSATSPVGGNMDYYWRSLVKKVPGAEATLQPDVNIWGQTTTKDSFGDWALDFANKFILPTNVKVTNRDAVDNELIRVVESTGNVDFLPSDGAKYFKVKGDTYKMNASQYTEYSKERGQAAYAALKSTMASASYKSASDEQKADMLKKALDNAYKAVNNTWKEKLGAFD